MSRTPLFAAIQKALALWNECQGSDRNHLARVAERRLGLARPFQWHFIHRSRLPDTSGPSTAAPKPLSCQPHPDTPQLMQSSSVYVAAAVVPMR